jgi:hypothetical protein
MTCVRETRESERRRMLTVMMLFRSIAVQLRGTERHLQGWLPARSAVEVVCGLDWERLSHGTRTAVGSELRDWFAAAFDFELTPVRLLRKTSGKGSHMIAVYPKEWLMAQRDRLLNLIGEASATQPRLPFGEVTTPAPATTDEGDVW